MDHTVRDKTSAGESANPRITVRFTRGGLHLVALRFVGHCYILGTNGRTHASQAPPAAFPLLVGASDHPFIVDPDRIDDHGLAVLVGRLESPSDAGER
ncbi:hypothetical protein GCM10008097_26390 [Mycetocola manganoxydans]|nr:hypothetical protein GCM10008097_26390 [Mycetocola manganoxydans]